MERSSAQMKDARAAVGSGGYGLAGATSAAARGQIDNLDLGLYVNWEENWSDRLRFLDSRKLAAQNVIGGLLMEMPSGRKFTFLPGGKGNNYRFHLKFPGYELHIAKAGSAGKSPNVYLSLNAKTLWLEAIHKIIDEIKNDLKTIGGGTSYLHDHVEISYCPYLLFFAVAGRGKSRTGKSLTYISFRGLHSVDMRRHLSSALLKTCMARCSWI